MRAPLNQIASAIVAGYLFTLHSVKQGSNDVAFKASVSGTDSAGAAVTYDVAGEDGKIRVFRDADDLLKAATGAGMMVDSVSITIDNLAILAPKPFTGDAIKKATTQVAQLTKKKQSVTERSSKLSTELTLMSQDPSVPASLIAERTAQKDAVDAYGVYLDAEVTRINAILANA